MSDRERWIVYPLLLFSIGIGMRDKLVQVIKIEELQTNRILGAKRQPCEEVIAQTIFSHKIICKEFEVVGSSTPAGQKLEPRVHIGQMSWPASDAKSAPQVSGGIEIYGANGEPIIQLIGLHEGHVKVNATEPQRGQELSPLGVHSIPALHPNGGDPKTPAPPPALPEHPGDLP